MTYKYWYSDQMSCTILKVELFYTCTEMRFSGIYGQEEKFKVCVCVFGGGGGGHT